MMGSSQSNCWNHNVYLPRIAAHEMQLESVVPSHGPFPSAPTKFPLSLIDCIDVKEEATVGIGTEII